MKKIPPFMLKRFPLTSEAEEIGFKFSDAEIGTRHRLGGEPSFMEPINWPSCDSCREPMTFYGQLDSISDEWILADAGVVEVYICFDCFTSQSIVQSS